MKKLIAIALMLALTLTLVACDSGETGYKDHFTHVTPEEMTDHSKILLERADFAEYIESVLNVQAYPDLLIFDDAGYEVVGMYIYDPETGLATGWTDLITGEKTMYEAGREIDLGKPDPSKMVQFKGTVKVGAVVYHKDGLVTGAELDFFLSETEDASLLKNYMETYQGETLEEVSGNHYRVVKDQAAVDEDFAAESAAGGSFFNMTAENYVSILTLNYGVSVIE